MVDKADEKDVPILQLDQERINRFARLSSKVQNLAVELKRKKEEQENLKDALAAVEEFSITADDDERLRVSMGECFVYVTNEEAEERLNSMIEAADTDVEAINSEVSAIGKEMSELKVVLYAKFGKTINLELDPEE